VPIYLGSDLRPVIRENSRLNAALIEAYAVAPVRKQLESRTSGAEPRLPTRCRRCWPTAACATSATRASTRRYLRACGRGDGRQAPEWAHRHAEHHRHDLGGTSFDIGTITAGYVPVEPSPCSPASS
jgi:hypothetical protein